jgi:hypothetical protein
MGVALIERKVRMAAPVIRVLGVYRNVVTDEMVREQTLILHGEGLASDDFESAAADCREQLTSAVLVEALVSNADDSFSVGDFAIADPKQPRDSWQVAWAEAYLSADGETLLSRGDKPDHLPSEFRVAFFIHFWNPALPLASSFGNLKCPPSAAMSERLSRLVPYELVD